MIPYFSSSFVCVDLLGWFLSLLSFSLALVCLLFCLLLHLHHHHSFEFKFWFYSMALIVWLVFHKRHCGHERCTAYMRLFLSSLLRLIVAYGIVSFSFVLLMCAFWSACIFCSGRYILIIMSKIVHRLSNTGLHKHTPGERKHSETKTTKISFGWCITVLNAKLMVTVINWMIKSR